MELVLLEGTLVPLAVLEVLRTLPVEHAVMPVAFVLPVPAFPIQHSPARLHSVSEVALVPAPIRPPERSSSVTLASLELPLVNVAFLSGPSVYAPSFLFVESELSDVVVPCCEIEFSLPLELTVMEVSVDDFVSVLEEADASTMGPVDFSLSQVDDLVVLEKLGGIEGWLGAQDQRRAVFDHQQLFHFQLDAPELPANEGRFVVEIV